MTDMIYGCKKCTYLRNGLCTRRFIGLSRSEFADTDGEDYQTEYFKACSDGTDKWRVRCRGKCIILNGEEFFTEDDHDDKLVCLTHARTGVCAGSIKWVQSHWEEVVKRAAEFPDVTTLPLKEGDDDGQD